ncbi:uncharacterized protein LOC128164871 isoform X3 [Crassostrea angulata]|uniref:uncharacterized protein LOC128164871 isoform X3 n=1 Tax=Magallana angulata TaxID=2784310 RepID=UPI0022B10778|nr:uncharacterized protein LOC128164871 isoform X3 [Crassostrea angulata]
MPMSSIDERPKTLKSGISLKTKYAVQHRSDMLIAEQMENVAEKQETLYNLLTELENAKTEEEIDRLRAEVQALKEKSDAALVLLHILYKINHELQYARKDLEEALKHTGGDILAARKRVMWLEDRMGTLCGKVRLRGQPVSQRVSHRTRGSTDRGQLTLTFRSDVTDVSDDDDQFTRQKSLPPIRQTHDDSDDDDRGRGMGGGRGGMMATPSMSGSEDFRDMQMKRPGMMDTPSSDASSSISPVKMGMMQHHGPQYSDDSDDEGSSPGASPIPKAIEAKEEEKRESSQSEGGSEAEDHIGELPTMFNQSKREISAQPRHSSPDIGPPPKQGIEIPTEEQEEEKAEEDQKLEEKESEEKSGEETAEETTSEEVPAGGDSGTQADKPPEEKTFITEVSVATNKSRVTIMSPKREDTRQVSQFPISPFLREIAEEERDLIMEYWQSEHHRFEYGQFSDVLTQLDPLSYHQMGLAVPGSFLEKYTKEFEALPWNIPENKKSAGDITDIHKRALDKLAVKVHQMYNKVFQATMLSVRPSKKPSDGQREVSFFQSIDHLSTKEPTMASSVLGAKTATSSTSVEDKIRPTTMQTVSSVEIPKLESRRLGTSKSGRLVYYPKPIPPPEVLPLTRTTTGKEYPKLANSFLNESENTKGKRRKPAVRIVDQRNLAEETKLTLYKERSRGRVKGPSTTEQKFRLMIAREKSATSSTKSDVVRRLGLSKTLTKISQDEVDLDFKSTSPEDEDKGSEAGSVWSKIKPKSRNREYSGLKWERVKTLVHTNLVSKRAEERVDAAKHLGLLRCGDTMVFYALKDKMKTDEDERVRYEAAKSLILVGCWEDEVQQVILKYLVIGNADIRLDLIKTMIDGKNVQYVNKKTNTFPELVKVLSHFCRNPASDDPIALEAAVLLGRLCVDDDNARAELKRSLESTTSDTHKKAKSLEILVKQLNCTDQDIVLSILDMIKSSFVWKYRVLATELLITLGIKHVCQDPEVVEKVYKILERRLWDDPTVEVRVASAKALTALGMFRRACDTIEKRLEDTDEDARSQAVISVGTLGMKNEKITRLLLEMLELDSSDYVRLMVVRTFVTLNMTEKRVIRALKERERAEGALGREAKKAVVILESLTQLPPPSPRRTQTPTFNNKGNSSLGFLRPVTQSV